jgi:hypothetical protein
MGAIYKLHGYFISKSGKPSQGNILRLLARELGLSPAHVNIDVREVEVEEDISEQFNDLRDCEKHFYSSNPMSLVREIKPGEIYQHFKGRRVKVINIGQDSEHVGSYYVVYEDEEDGAVWCRPYDMFISKVDKTKYPDATQEYRFELVK